jgi:hypothetical protein
MIVVVVQIELLNTENECGLHLDSNTVITMIFFYRFLFDFLELFLQVLPREAM